jgi:mRNA-degrading endonuclease toxin of MazEF toxin-antitoxin module
VPERGDVVRVRRRIGFEPRGADAQYLVLSPAKLGAMLPTLLGVPLHIETAADRGVPGNVRVRAAEGGADVDLVAVTSQLGPIRPDDLEPGARSRISPTTMQAIENAIRLVLGFRA